MDKRKNQVTIINEQNIQTKIYTMRNTQVMIDRDLAKLYGVETKVFNQAVKRNIGRFPADFMFQMTKEELENWRSQFVTSNSDKMGLRRAPYAFTEQGVSMLSAILKSDIAIEMSVQIIRAFVQMRSFMSQNTLLFQKIEFIEKKQRKTDEQMEKVLTPLKIKVFLKRKVSFSTVRFLMRICCCRHLLKRQKSLWCS